MSNVIKVGIFVTVVLAVLAYLVIKVEDWSLFGSAGQRVEDHVDPLAGYEMHPKKSHLKVFYRIL
ncbi:MAG: hypothetical protein SX243_21775 [Acidobacteriota bacterium]|nr:hypothetical protein [Acidobacteriota bacterium]